MKVFRFLNLLIFAAITFWSCDKTSTDIDYSGRYQGERVETTYSLDTDSNLIATTNTYNDHQTIVEKGRNGYYVLQGGTITYFVDGRGEGSTDPSITDYYVRTSFELKSDSLTGATDEWWTNNGELGWWTSSSEIDSNNYRHTKYKLKAL